MFPTLFCGHVDPCCPVSLRPACDSAPLAEWHASSSTPMPSLTATVNGSQTKSRPILTKVSRQHSTRCVPPARLCRSSCVHAHLTGVVIMVQESFVGEWNLQSTATLLAGLAPATAPSPAVTSSRGRHLLYSFSDFLAAITNPQGTYQSIAAANLQVSILVQVSLHILQAHWHAGHHICSSSKTACLDLSPGPLSLSCL